MFLDFIENTAIPVAVINLALCAAAFMVRKMIAKAGKPNNHKELEHLLTCKALVSKYCLVRTGIFANASFIATQLICSYMSGEYTRPAWYIILGSILLVEIVQWRLKPIKVPRYQWPGMDFKLATDHLWREGVLDILASEPKKGS
jgi:hypothetical protein